MAAFMLDSLVLRGISVLRDEVADTLRRGTSYTAGDKTPEIPFSMRHPSHGWQPVFNAPVPQPDPVVDHYRVAAAAKAQDLPLCGAVAEYGISQYEINLRHVADPLLADAGR